MQIFEAHKHLSTAETTLAAIAAIGYYVPHYLLNLFIKYLENDPTRSQPAWGWLLAFGLFVSNALIYILNSVIWSISTTALQAGIKLQLNTMLYTKTLVKKDVASVSDDSGNVGGVEEEAAKDKKMKENGEQEKGSSGEDEGVTSKTQIMVRTASKDSLLVLRQFTDTVYRRRRSCDRIRLPR